MDDETLRSTLDALSQEASSAEERVNNLQLTLAIEQQRLQHIRGAIQNLRFLLGETPEPFRQTGAIRTTPGFKIRLGVSPDELQADDLESLVDDDQDLVSSGDFAPQVQPIEDAEAPSPAIKRTPSTDWLAEIVNASGRVMSREEVFREYELQRGFPESWVNPRNSLGNALNRAVRKKMIRALPGDHYAPLDLDLFAPVVSRASDSSDPEEL